MMIQCQSFLRLAKQGYFFCIKKIQLSFLILTFLSRVAKYSTKVELTSVRYPVKRGKYGTITDNDLKVFESIVGSNGVITDDTELEGRLFREILGTYKFSVLNYNISFKVTTLIG